MNALLSTSVSGTESGLIKSSSLPVAIPRRSPEQVRKIASWEFDRRYNDDRDDEKTREKINANLWKNNVVYEIEIHVYLNKMNQAFELMVKSREVSDKRLFAQFFYQLYQSMRDLDEVFVTVSLPSPQGMAFYNLFSSVKELLQSSRKKILINSLPSLKAFTELEYKWMHPTQQSMVCFLLKSIQDLCVEMEGVKEPIEIHKVQSTINTCATQILTRQGE